MNFRSAIIRTSALMMGMMLCSCLPLTRLDTYGEFDGVNTCLNEQSTVTLFISHGMGGYSEGDPLDLIGGIVHELCMVPDGGPLVRKVVSGDPERQYGCVERQDYCNPHNGKKLRVYFLDWRKATWDEKGLLREVDRLSCDDCKRVAFIRQWRKQLITDVVADVTLYLGKHGSQIRFPFKQAVRWIYEDSKDLENHEIVSVNFSLGSQMLLDTLEDMSNDAEDTISVAARDHFVDRTRSFFMMSNQFPLVYLHKMPIRDNRYTFDDGATCNQCCACNIDCPLHEQFEPLGVNWNETSLGHFVLDKRRSDPGFKLINFGDPNDLLNFSVDTEALPYCTCGATSEGLIHNVDVRNVKWALFGKMVNPAKAHQDYGENPYVIGMVCHGLHCYHEEFCCPPPCDEEECYE